MEKTEEIRMVSNFQKVSLKKAEKLIQDGHFKKINITTDMKNIVKEIIKDISAAGVKSLNTLMLKSHDSYFMDHAVNTTVLATLIAQKYNFSSKEISELALGTFLHDIGKTIIEQFQDYDKPESTKEYYVKHSQFGYELLKYNYDISPVETQIVYQHHEHQDGSGFPKGLIGDNIPPVKLKERKTKGRIFRLAQICCVANVYDKMVLNPSCEKQMDPHDVIKQIIKDSGTKYNKSVVQALFQVIPLYQVGVYVKVIDSSDPTILN
ncbi:MAG: HD domain-containing protein, partial [Candidatus Heimdallarchaeota archaeon]|nr:HD domain-containing protein [Candidatus Heimdallarchaeota archaeon]